MCFGVWTPARDTTPSLQWPLCCLFWDPPPSGAGHVSFNSKATPCLHHGDATDHSATAGDGFLFMSLPGFQAQWGLGTGMGDLPVSPPHLGDAYAFYREQLLRTSWEGRFTKGELIFCLITRGPGQEAAAPLQGDINNNISSNRNSGQSLRSICHEPGSAPSPAIPSSHLLLFLQEVTSSPPSSPLSSPPPSPSLLSSPPSHPHPCRHPHPQQQQQHHHTYHQMIIIATTVTTTTVITVITTIIEGCGGPWARCAHTRDQEPRPLGLQPVSLHSS